MQAFLSVKNLVVLANPEKDNKYAKALFNRIRSEQTLLNLPKSGLYLIYIPSEITVRLIFLAERIEEVSEQLVFVNDIKESILGMVNEFKDDENLMRRKYFRKPIYLQPQDIEKLFIRWWEEYPRAIEENILRLRKGMEGVGNLYIAISNIKASVKRNEINKARLYMMLNKITILNTPYAKINWEFNRFHTIVIELTLKDEELSKLLYNNLYNNIIKNPDIFDISQIGIVHPVMNIDRDLAVCDYDRIERSIKYGFVILNAASDVNA